MWKSGGFCAVPALLLIKYWTTFHLHPAQINYQWDYTGIFVPFPCLLVRLCFVFSLSAPEKWDLLKVLSCSQIQSIFHNSEGHGAIDAWLCTDSTAGQRWSYTVELDVSDGGVGRWMHTHHTHTRTRHCSQSAGLENKTTTRETTSMLAWWFTVTG